LCRNGSPSFTASPSRRHRRPQIRLRCRQPGMIAAIVTQAVQILLGSLPGPQRHQRPPQLLLQGRWSLRENTRFLPYHHFQRRFARYPSLGLCHTLMPLSIISPRSRPLKHLPHTPYPTTLHQLSHCVVQDHCPHHLFSTPLYRRLAQ
jgi:hypothetical protein